MTTATREAAEELTFSITECNRGKPRRFMENYLWVRSGDDFVPFRFSPNQEAYYESTFDSLSSYRDPFEAFILKDRKAWSTTFWVAAAFTFMATVPGFSALVVADSDDTFNAIDEMLDVYNLRLPEYYRPKVKHWEAKQFRQYDWSTQGAPPSSITLSSARTRNLGRGQTPKMVILSEMAHYSSTFESDLFRSLGHSLTTSAWVIKESTPNGTKNRFYADYRAYKEKRRNLVYVFRRWFDNPVNALKPGHPFARPSDVGPITIGDADELIGEKYEKELIPLFPQDAIPIEDGLRWRRYKISEEIVNAESKGGNENLGYSAFLQEHAEDDSSCWVNLTNPQFDTAAISYVLSLTRPPLSDTLIGSGMRQRTWQKPIPGHVYVAGMDVSSGSATDFSSLQILDVSDGSFMAELHGKVDPGEFAQAAVELCLQYNNALLAIERTGGYGTGPLGLARKLGANLYRRPRKPGELVTSPAYLNRPYGWETTGGTNGTRAFMITDLQAAINRQEAITYNKDLIDDLQSYDPDVDNHLADRHAAACIAWQMRQFVPRGQPMFRGGSKIGQKALRIFNPRRSALTGVR